MIEEDLLKSTVGDIDSLSGYSVLALNFVYQTCLSIVFIYFGSRFTRFQISSLTSF